MNRRIASVVLLSAIPIVLGCGGTGEPTANFPENEDARSLVSAGEDLDDASQAIVDAVSLGDRSSVEDLLNRSPDLVRTTDSHGLSLLHVAAESGDVEVARLLVEKGADVEQGARGRETPLHVAALLGALPTVNLLLDNGANLEARDRRDRTPLDFAVSVLGNEETVRQLILKGAEVNVRDDEGDSPLHVAVCSGSGEAVRLLLAAGADVRAVNNRGQTPLDIARETMEDLTVHWDHTEKRPPLEQPWLEPCEKIVALLEEESGEGPADNSPL